MANPGKGGVEGKGREVGHIRSAVREGWEGRLGWNDGRGGGARGSLLSNNRSMYDTFCYGAGLRSIWYSSCSSTPALFPAKERLEAVRAAIPPEVL